MKNILKRATALLLSLLMVFSVCSTSLIVYANAGSGIGESIAQPDGTNRVSKETINYVSLGDSMTNGYGLEGYNHNSGVEDYGTGAYPNQFAAWLDLFNGEATVNHAQLAMSGIRTEDIHWLLEFDYTNANLIKVVDEFVAENNKKDEVWDQDKWEQYFDCGDYWTVNEICNHSRTNATYAHIAGGVYEAYEGCTDHGMVDNSFFSDIPDVDNSKVTMGEKVAVIAKYYQEKVFAADIISLSVGNGNIGVFGFGRILETIGFADTTTYLNYNYEDVLRECDEDMQERLMAMIAEIKPALTGMFPDNDKLINVAVYIAVSLTMNYAGTVDAILQMNPDVEIILMPVMNTFGDPKDGFEAGSLGAMMEYVVEPINKFIAALPTYMQVTNHGVYEDAKFYYAEPEYVQCMVATYEYPLSKTPIIRDRFVESIVGYCNCGKNCDAAGNDASKCKNWKNGMIWDMLADMELVQISLADIQGYDIRVDEETTEHIPGYEDLDDAGKLAYAAGAFKTGEDDKTDYSKKAMAISMYLAFEKAIVEGKDNSVMMDSIFGLGEVLGGGGFDTIMENFYAQTEVDGAAKLDVVAEFIAANSGDMLDADQVKALVTAENEAALDALVYGIVAGIAMNMMAEMGFTVKLTADQVKILCAEAAEDADEETKKAIEDAKNDLINVLVSEIATGILGENQINAVFTAEDIAALNGTDDAAKQNVYKKIVEAIASLPAGAFDEIAAGGGKNYLYAAMAATLKAAEEGSEFYAYNWLSADDIAAIDTETADDDLYYRLVDVEAGFEPGTAAKIAAGDESVTYILYALVAATLQAAEEGSEFYAYNWLTAEMIQAVAEDKEEVSSDRALDVYYKMVAASAENALELSAQEIEAIVTNFAAADETTQDKIFTVAAEQASGKEEFNGMTLDAATIKAIYGGSYGIDLQNMAFVFVDTIISGYDDAVAFAKSTAQTLVDGAIANAKNEIAVEGLDKAKVTAAGIVAGGLNTAKNAITVDGLAEAEAKINYFDIPGKITLFKSKIPELQKGAKTLFAVPETAELLCTLLVVPDTLADVLGKSEMAGLLALFARCYIGNGIGAHPSQAGHDNLAAAVIAAYFDFKTAEDKTDENIDFEDMPVVKDIISYLTACGYLNDDQIIDIAFKAYEIFVKNVGTSLDLAKYMYETLFYAAGMDDANRLAIIGGTYDIIKAHGYFTDETGNFKADLKVLAVLEDIVNDEEGVFSKITDAQAWEIVNKIYTFAVDPDLDSTEVNFTEDEIRYLAYYIFCVVLSGTKPENAIPFNGRRGGGIEEQLYAFSASEKLAIIDAVYESMKKNGLVDTTEPEMKAFDDLYTELIATPENADAILSEADSIAILENVLTSVGTAPEINETVITQVAQDSVNILLNSEDMSTEDILTLVEKISGAITNSGLGGGDTTVTVLPDLTIAKDLVNALNEDGVVTDAQAKEIISTLLDSIMAGDLDPTTLVDDIYEIVYDKGFSVEKTVRIVIVIHSTLYENEYIYNFAQPYYADAMAKVLAAENVVAAKAAVDAAIKAIEQAIEYLSKSARGGIETDTTALKAALIDELNETRVTLKKIKAVLENDVEDLKDLKGATLVLLTFESDLWAHIDNISDIVLEAGLIADPYILAVINTVNYYAGIAADRAQAAYDWCVANVQGFVANYIAFVDMVAAEAAKIDPALGTAVRDFMINTPADTFNLIALYGDKAIDKLILDATVASGEIYFAVELLVDLFVDNGKVIYNAVMNSDECTIILAKINKLTEQLAGLMASNTPAATINGLEIEKIKGDIAALAEDFYKAALVAIENVDPALAAELRDTIGAIATIISTASGEYGNFFVANAAELGGMIVSAFLQNWNKFAGVAAPIFIAIGHSIEEYVGGIAHDVRVQIEYQLDILEEELKKLNAQLQYVTGEIDKHIIEKIDLINTKIDELRKILDDGLRDNIIRAGQLVKELGEDVYDLAIALKDASLEAASKAFAKIAADLAELDKVVTEVLGKQYTALKEQLGEFAVKLFNNLINTALALVPELDKQLYDYFYNNPEEVIAFFHEYSDEIAKFASLYGEETLGVIVIALAAAGPYVAEYIMENPESALAGLTAWADKYGDRILAILDVYDDYCPVHNAVKEEIAKLQAELIVLNGQLIELNKQLQTATGAAIDAINAEIAKVQAEIARVQAKINALIEKLQNLDDAVAQLNAALKLFAANAYEAAAKAVLEAVTNLDKAIQEILSDVSNEVAEQLKQLLKDGKELTIELLKDLADLILETAVKYAPIVDEELYNYFYNNPEEVIAFFNEYGDDIIDLCEEYGDYALVLVGAALVYYGDDLAAYIINNPETVLAGLTAWADKYGDRVAALLQVYADALGVCDAVRAERDALYAELAALQAKLEALNAQLQTATGKAREIILAEIAKVQAEIARVQAKIAELNAKLQNLVNAIYNLDAALKQFVDGALDTATAAVIVAIDNLNKAIKDLMDSVSDDVAAKLEQLLNTGMGLTLDLLADLADLAAEAVRKYAPELDAYLYNYFLNNADEVIAFFNEYGDKIIELCEKYGDKALAIIAIALASCGRELAEYIVNNSEALLAGMAEWVEIYGDKIVAMLQAYAEALGLCDAVREEIAILNNKLSALQAELMNQFNILQNQFQVELNALYAQLKDATEAQKAIILEKIKEIEFKIELIQQYIAELQAQIVALQAKIAELNAKLQALVIALQNLDDALMALLEVGVEAGVAAVQNAISEVAKAITDLVGVISDNIAAQIDKLLQKAKDYLNGAYNSAILVDYIINNQSSYLAFGDDELAAKILEAYLKNYVADANVGYAYKDATVVTSNKITDILNSENLKLVAESDLISLGYSFNKIANDTVRAAIEYLMLGEPTVPTNFDWVGLVGAEAAVEVEKLLDEVYAAMLDAGLDATIPEDIGYPVKIADIVMTAVEYFAYNAIEYAVYLPKVVGAINQINPDAVIMINAISNPIAGAKISFAGQEFVFGDYLNYVCDAIYVENIVLATMYENVVFVPTTEIETSFTDRVITLDAFELMALYTDLLDGKAIVTTENGSAYTAVKMQEALNIIVRPSALLGDVNHDGIVDYVDAIFILEYDAMLPVNIDLTVADVDGNGIVDYNDAIWVLEYDAMLIDKFPAEN